VNNKITIISVWLFASFFLTGCKTMTESASQADQLGATMKSAEGHTFFTQKCRECQDYDWKNFTNILSRCDDLVDKNNAFTKKTAEVIATFNLQNDGSVNDIIISGDTNSIVASFLVQAIKDCAPFPRWPDQMRSVVKQSYREIKFRLFVSQNLHTVPA
jgi:hypothetical protein